MNPIKIYDPKEEMISEYVYNFKVRCYFLKKQEYFHRDRLVRHSYDTGEQNIYECNKCYGMYVVDLILNSTYSNCFFLSASFTFKAYN